MELFQCWLFLKHAFVELGFGYAAAIKILKNLSSPLNLLEFDPTILGIDLSSLTMLTAS